MASKDYLQKYLGSAPKARDEYAEAPKKKRRKRRAAAPVKKAMGVVVMDDDIDVLPAMDSAPSTTLRIEKGLPDSSSDDGEVQRRGGASRLDSSDGGSSDGDMRARGRLDSSSDDGGNDSDLPARRRLDSDDDDSDGDIVRGGSGGRGRMDSDDDEEEMQANTMEPVRIAPSKKTGLISAEEMRREEQERLKEKKRREREARKDKKQTKEETVYRDKRGRRLETLETFIRQTEGSGKSKELEDLAWGQGKVQKQKEKEALAMLKSLRNAPFARDVNDPELDDLFKDRDRFEDPMAQFLSGKKKKKKGKKRKRGDAMGSDEDIERARVERPLYCGPPGPANRFNIPPGFRWDGVDRTNGQEAWLFKITAGRAADESESYKWRTQDM